MSTPSIAIALMALTFTFLRRRGEEHVSPSQVTHEVELMVSTELFLVKKEVSDDVGDELSLSLTSSGETDVSSSATEATTRPSRKDCRRRSR
mmetsp:Transcript_8189/g.13919  ORF Transcript_8189/g.13919 Transcript_8189/m.13919 type:complete len:92 (+) Transcript_8189:1605-1880(+)|eukprot:scaffold14202_cov66-Skeletonema_marinoi.AAC.1